MLRTLGAELILTSAEDGLDGAWRKAKQLSKYQPDEYSFVDQLSNESTVSAHYKGTGTEIWFETGGRATHLIAGMGTSGTLMGAGRKLREHNPDVKIIGLQPTSEAHIIEGWKHLASANVPEVYDSIALDVWRPFFRMRVLEDVNPVLTTSVNAR